MLICGVKASHDGGVALIDGNRLVFSVEMEKLANAPRYSQLGDLRRVAEVLCAEGVDPAEVDRFVVDGWWAEDGLDEPGVSVSDDGRPTVLPVAPYLEAHGVLDPTHRHTFSAHDFGPRGGGYASYFHVANHLLGAYCSSPFAARGEDALVLVWDGGTTPRLYRVDGRTRAVRLVSSLLPLPGNYFSDFCSHFEPFHRDTTGLDREARVRHHLSVAGKAMAYAALGRVEPSAFPEFDRLIAGFPTISPDNAFALGEKVAANRDQIMPGLSNADIIATFQEYLGGRLADRLVALVRRRFPDRRINLALGGGCALNIKWNSRLRETGLFASVWVPPFPNDSGAAIGTACCEMFREGAGTALDWNVYRGPRIAVGELPAGWSAARCDERALARLLHTEGEPVVVLSGRAEIGPRALGNRSILAPATDPAMKDRLNGMKDRASYRPVAPICLTDRAEEVFAPGGADPYMLFEHTLRGDWAERVPAVVHLDGTARLQTIDADSGSATATVLAEYARLSGVPVLCNTSANLNGRGFFPDVASAARWGRTRYVWSDGTLYTNPAATLPGTAP
ncbi:carbamoyltransferase N-terminal domain-containing protein [Streptomyces sp. NBRC 109706]|uniref:carbamoyltransferase N-terminal domain-containing protein n=1 Tax=Streptomyces sp. NBRC 109706 TaxID=1550035 RepID=UPI0007806438|nr:carbamoyltransferase N-terminal domain-containing protein [Streptomyces sp. NBRC 109706]